MTSWIDHTIWWHVYPLGFTGAPVRPGDDRERALVHRLDRLEPWLDYLVELGANGLALGPVFQSRTHGYDTTDYFRIDPRLGDDTTFDRLVTACDDRGIRIMLDGVFNHVGTEHPAFRRAADGTGSRELFRMTGSGEHLDYADFEGHRQLAALDHDSDATVDLVVDVMTHWLGRGVDAWRLDAAYAVPVSFWQRVLPRVRSEYPQAWFVGEVIHGDYARLVADSGLDSVTQYELWKALWSSLHDGNFYALDWCLQRHSALLDDFTPMTFVGNHDVTRIATRVGTAEAALAAVVLFTVGGIPSVYYGDEQGFTGTKTEREGGDDEVRPPMPLSPAELSGLGAGMFEAHRRLVGVRRRNPWLSTARTRVGHLSNRAYDYRCLGADGQTLDVRLRLDPDPVAEIDEHRDGRVDTLRIAL